MVDVNTLRKFSLFNELDDSQLQKFANVIKEIHYPAGSIVCTKGEKGDELFLVKRGQVSVVLPLHRYDSKYKTVSKIGEGNLFGELSFFEGKERTADIQTNEPLELLILSRSDYDKIIKDNIEEGCKIQNNIIAGLVGIIRNMNETYSSAGFLI